VGKGIGILGGTFDPVHFGHLRLALEVYQALDLTEVRLIPLHTPPHRRAPIAGPTQRLTMLQLAVTGTTGLVVDDREIIRGKTSYTVETLQSLRTEIGNTPLFLILGVDAFQSLNTWYLWTAIPEYAHIILAGRPGSKETFKHNEVRKLYSSRVCNNRSALRKPCGRIMKIDVPALDISATRIRSLCSQNKELHYLLPDDVISYIKRESLYT
jgi:nicotinate-nucleotide adenylyltransferase